MSKICKAFQGDQSSVDDSGPDDWASCWFALNSVYRYTIISTYGVRAYGQEAEIKRSFVTNPQKSASITRRNPNSIVWRP